jgi:hypothetical protein
MESIYLYAALLDVLAYRDLLHLDRESGRLDFQGKLSAALRIFESVNEAVFQVQAISDTIIVTCRDHGHFPEFLNLLRSVFVAFLQQGLLVRGGIAYSQHFQSNHLTYSHAVWRAYELESSVAVYPRIVLDKNVVDMYEVASDLPPIRSRNLLCVENGVFFLDVLTRDNWTEVYDYARKIYESNRDQQVHSSRKVFTSINSCSNRSGRVRCGN